MTYVLGPPGAGKSTVARLVTGLEQPEYGEIFFGDRLVNTLPPAQRGTGMVFQDLGLWPGLSVIENVGYPLKFQKLARPEHGGGCRKCCPPCGSTAWRAAGPRASRRSRGCARRWRGHWSGSLSSSSWMNRSARSSRARKKSAGKTCGASMPRPA